MNPRQLLPLAALVAACARAPVAPPRGASPGDYFPLAVGNEWVYRDESPNLPPRAGPSSRTVRILERTRDGYYRDNERGELRADPDCLHDRSRRLLCAPIEPGKTWASVVSVASTERYEIAAVGETVVTPAGRFEGCVRVRALNRASPGTDHILEITYAPRVGPVRIETFVVVGGKVTPQIRAVLERYRLEER